MAKRGAEAQSSRTGAFNGGGTNMSGEESDVPQRATAAQMAKRKMASGRKPGRATGALSSQNQGAGFAQQQQQQQQSPAPFGNVDPNVVNGTSNQPNSSAPTAINPVVDPHSSSFNLLQYNRSQHVPGYVPKAETNGASSAFNFNANGGTPASNPFSPVFNDCEVESKGGGTMIGYAGSLFSMPAPTPAQPKEVVEVPKRQEARHYRVDPNLNKKNEGKLWVSHAPFIQSQADQIRDNSKSLFTDAIQKKASPSNPFGQSMSQLKSLPDFFGASISQAQNSEQSQQSQQQEASPNPFKPSAQPTSSSSLFGSSFNQSQQPQQPQQPQQSQQSQQPQQSQQSQPFSINFGQQQSQQPQQSQPFSTGFGQQQQAQQPAQQQQPFSGNFGQPFGQPEQEQPKQPQKSQPFSINFGQQQQPAQQPAQQQQPFSGNFGQPFGQPQQQQQSEQQSPQSNSFSLFAPRPNSPASVFGSSSFNQSQQPQQPQQPQSTQSFPTSFGQQQQSQPQQSSSGNFSQPFGQQQQSTEPSSLFSQAPQVSSSNMFNMQSKQASQPASEAAHTFGNPGQSSFGNQPNSTDLNTSMGGTEERIGSMATGHETDPQSTPRFSSFAQKQSAYSPTPSSTNSAAESTVPPWFAPSSSTSSGPAWSSVNSSNGLSTPKGMFGQTNSTNERVQMMPAEPVPASSMFGQSNSTSERIRKISPEPVPTTSMFRRSNSTIQRIRKIPPEPVETSSMFGQSNSTNERIRKIPAEPVETSSMSGSNPNWLSGTPSATSQNIQSSDTANGNGDETPRPALNKETVVKPLFPTSTPSQNSIFSTSSIAQPSALTGGYLSSSSSTPIAKPADKASEAPSSSGQRSSTNQQMETLMPPTCPSNFNEIQKQEYITHYRIRSLNHAFKKHIDGALTCPVEAEVLGFYQAKMDQILLNGSLSQKSGTKRKYLADAHAEIENGPSKRINTTGTRINGDSSLPTSSSINKSKRKADEDINKGSDENGFPDTAKKVRGDLSYPTLPQTSTTARLFAKAANGDASTSASNLIANGIDSSQSSKVGSQLNPAKSSMFNSSVGNTGSPSIFSTPTAAATNTAGSAQSMFQFKPTTARTTTPAKESTFNVGSTKTQDTSAAPNKSSGGLFQNSAGPIGSSNTNLGTSIGGSATVAAQSSTFKVPSFGAPSGTSFMSQFGQNAKKTEEEMAKEAKAKRKADEYDSEDSEDEEAWERKYEEEQRAKKQKIEEAKVNTTFKFMPNKGSDDKNKDAESASAPHQVKPAVSSSSKPSGSASILQTPSETSWANPWAHLKTHGSNEKQGDDESESSDEDEPEAQASKIETALASDTSSASAPRSLFDRIETNSDGSLKRETSATSVNEQKQAPRSDGLFSTQSTFQSTSSSNTTAPRSGLFGQPFPNSQTTGLFGSSSDRSPTPKTALASPQLNNTWANGSPIKFGGASAAPSLSFTSPSPSKPAEKEQNSSPFSTLFGAKPATNTFSGQSTIFGASSSSTPSTTTGSLFATAQKASPPVPTVGFQFGGPPKPFGSLAAPSPFASAASSRATSPGISTGGESAAEGDEEAGPLDAQIDLASARAGEESEECLLEVKAKSLELGWATTKDEVQDQSQEKKWITKGLGPLRILKDHTTGRVRIVHRMEGSGKIILNAALMAGMTYKHAADKTVTFGVATGAGSIAQWSIMVGQKEKAAQLAGLLESNKSN
ncbi:hypothetical protein MMC11_001564 [Xylographa trunciseda]|nr:hypothetical protein [Xylographa trunciseda]